MTEQITITSNEFVETCYTCGEPTYEVDCLCVICDWCSEPTISGDITNVDNANTCNDCYAERFTSCDNCGEPTADEYITFCYECDEYSCSYCAEDRGCNYGHEDEYYNGLPEGIHEYSYKPDPIFHSNQGQDTKIFLGVELETEHADGYGYDGNLNSIVSEVYDSGGEDFAYLKEDGSISGVEIVTHPATLEFHQESGHWERIFDAIDDDGLYDSDGAGIHVHVSRAGLGDTPEKIEQSGTNALALLELHWDEWVKIARRVSGQWAPKNCGAVDLKSTPENEVDDVLDYGKSYGKYKALNFSPDNTIEFRLFRSTTNINELLACLETVQLIVELAIEWDIRDILTTPFSRIIGEAKIRGFENLINLWVSK